jgi:LysM repeat protein
MDTGFSGLVAGILYGMLTAGLAVVLVAGGFVLSFSEGGLPLVFLPSPTTTPTSLPLTTQIQQLVTVTLPATATVTHTITGPPSPTSTATATLPPTLTSCPPPPGWKPITVTKRDTLNNLAQEYDTTPDDLIEANCLVKSQLEPGTTLYVPGEALPSPVPCGPPGSWVYTYIVQPGDTLYTISRRAGVSVAQIKTANCLTSDSIRVGQKLFLPVPVEPPEPPTRTPTEVEPPSPTSPPTETPAPTNTPEVIERTPGPPDPTLELPSLPGTR